MLELCACSGQDVPHSSEELLPTRRELIRTFRQQNKVLVVYGASVHQFRHRFREAALKLKERFSDGRFEVLVRSHEEVTPAELDSLPLIVVGSPTGNSVIGKIASDLPVQFQRLGFEFEKQSFTDSSNVFCLSFYPNPFNPQLPISLVTGCSEGALCDLYDQQWQRLIWNSWDYEVYNKQQRVLMGRFRSDSTHRWEVDRDTRFDMSQLTQTEKQSQHFRFITHDKNLSKAEWEALMEACEENYVAIDSFVGTHKMEEERIDYHIYPTAEMKGLMLNNTDCAQIDEENNCVHAVFNDHFTHSDEEGENRLLLRQRLGKPTTIALEKGLALTFTEHWQKKGHMYWARRLFQSDNMPPLADLLDNEWFEKSSELVTSAVAGSFVSFLIEEWGKEVFLEKYATWVPTQAETRKLARKWDAFLSLSLPIIPPPRQASIPPYLKGFNFTHEGYQIYNGYISKKAAESLAYLKDMGANAAAIVPYTGMRQNEASFLGINDWAGGENDESIIHALAKAKSLGMTTLLKPQVWVNDGWPGSVSFEEEAEWQKFFDYYHQWILHYALMAEIHGVDILCLGVEFEKATLSHEAEWRKITAKIRGIYTGKLTYAANWGEEFEKVGFWDLFDYIGLNCYYPLTSSDDPTDEELQAGCAAFAKKVEKVLKRFPKPLLITELGYRSVTAPWQHPHEEAGDRAFNAEDQARAYEATFQALEDKEWCKGLFWWKWSTFLDDMEPGDRRFIPYKKPAEAVVRKWYGG